MMIQKNLLIAVLALIMPPSTLQSQVCSKIVSPKKVSPNSTYCNPLNIGYCFRPDGKTGRDRAGPLIVSCKGDYYLFASKSAGYWLSHDLLNWNLVQSNDSYQYKNDEHQLNGQPEKDLPVWGYNLAIQAPITEGTVFHGTRKPLLL